MAVPPSYLREYKLLGWMPGLLPASLPFFSQPLLVSGHSWVGVGLDSGELWWALTGIPLWAAERRCLWPYRLAACTAEGLRLWDSATLPERLLSPCSQLATSLWVSYCTFLSEAYGVLAHLSEPEHTLSSLCQLPVLSLRGGKGECAVCAELCWEGPSQHTWCQVRDGQCV